MIRGHGGNIDEAAKRAGCFPAEIVDMSSNINPLGPPPGLVANLQQHMEAISALPEVDARQAVAAYAEWQRLLPMTVLAGAGTTQFLYQIPRALHIGAALVVAPTYADYADALAINRVDYRHFMLDENNGFVPDLEKLRNAAKSVDAVYVCNPNNPTGVFVPTDDLVRLARGCPETLFVVDESYLPFAGDAGDDSMAHRGLSNVIVLQSLSKMFCIPGLRVGFCVAPNGLAEAVSRQSPPWAVNAQAQQAVAWIAGHPEAAADHVARTRQFLETERAAFLHNLEGVPGLQVFPGRATFLLFSHPDRPAAEVVDALLARRFLVRDCANFVGLSKQFFRVSLKSPEQNRQVAGLLADFFARPEKKGHF